MQHATTTRTTLITLLSAALSACGGDGGTLSRSPDAATEGGTEGRTVIVATANGEIVQLARDAAAPPGTDGGEAAPPAATDAGGAQSSSDAARTDDGATSSNCEVSDGCALCWGAYPINCCRAGGVCGCRYMDQECQ